MCLWQLLFAVPWSSKVKFSFCFILFLLTLVYPIPFFILFSYIMTSVSLALCIYLFIYLFLFVLSFMYPFLALMAVRIRLSTNFYSTRSSLASFVTQPSNQHFTMNYPHFTSRSLLHSRLLSQYLHSNSLSSPCLFFLPPPFCTSSPLSSQKLPISLQQASKTTVRATCPLLSEVSEV